MMLALILIGLAAFGAVGYMIYQLVKEIGPTIDQARSFSRALQTTIQNSQEIGDRFQAISNRFSEEAAEASQMAETAREVIFQVTTASEAVRPVAEAVAAYTKNHTSPEGTAAIKQELNELVSASKKLWDKAKRKIRTRFSRGSTFRTLAIQSVSLILGTAAGGYVGYLLRLKYKASHEKPYRSDVAPPPMVLPRFDKKPATMQAEKAQWSIPEEARRRSLGENFRILWGLIKKTFSDWNDDNASELGASLAYYSVFSISPLLIIAIAIAGFLFGQKAAEGEIVRQIGGVIGQSSAEVIQGLIQKSRQPATGIIATVIGIVTLLFGATGVFAELQSALDRIWKIPPKPGRGIWGLIKGRFTSFTMVLGIGFLLLISLILSAALTAFSKFLGDTFVASLFVLQLINGILSFGVITLLFAMIYKIVPDVEIEWSDVWLGALITSIFFGIGKFLISLYLGRSTVGSTFGAAGSLVVILVWVYYSAQIFLFGAEFTQVFAKHRGSWRLGKTAAEKIKPERKDS